MRPAAVSSLLPPSFFCQHGQQHGHAHSTCALSHSSNCAISFLIHPFFRITHISKIATSFSHSKTVCYAQPRCSSSIFPAHVCRCPSSCPLCKLIAHPGAKAEKEMGIFQNVMATDLSLCNRWHIIPGLQYLGPQASQRSIRTRPVEENPCGTRYVWRAVNAAID